MFAINWTYCFCSVYIVIKRFKGLNISLPFLNINFLVSLQLPEQKFLLQQLIFFQCRYQTHLVWHKSLPFQPYITRPPILAGGRFVKYKICWIQTIGSFKIFLSFFLCCFGLFSVKSHGWLVLWIRIPDAVLLVSNFSHWNFFFT